MISIIPQHLSVLQSRAWTTDHAHQIVSNVLEHVSRWAPTPMVLNIIFPECGSGYHEWNVIVTLIQAGYTINEAIFMDSRIEPLWTEEWYRLALGNQVQMQIFYSYVALELWTQKQALHHKVLVIYINGGLKFGLSYCGCITHTKLGPSVCLNSAIQFWEWCDKNANNPIINFIGRDIRHPGDCKSWTDSCVR
jgi:hypothetical protein